jgi:hypothetical protein
VPRGNFIDQTLASSLNIITHTRSPLLFRFKPWPVRHSPSPWSPVIRRPSPFSLPVHKIILVLPWLQCHNPTISWSRMRITDCSPECRQTCFPVLCGSMSVESPMVAQHPRGISEPAGGILFLLIAPGTVPSTCFQVLCRCIYPLSVAENQAMEDYIQVAFQQGFIRTSTCPASALFFFIAKKYGGLCPCID